MNCYNHQTTPAVGICKNCNKGICPDCLTEVDNGIACTSTCVEQVNMLNQLINRNKNMATRTSGVYFRNAFIYGAFAVVFIYVAFTSPEMRFFMYPVGVVLLIGFVLMLYNALKVNKS